MASNTSSSTPLSATTTVSFDENGNPVFPLDLSGFDAVAASCKASTIWEGGEDTGKPKYDEATGKRLYGVKVLIAPKGASVGQDRSFYLSIPSDGAPVVVARNGNTPVELVNPRLVLLRGTKYASFELGLDAIKPKKAN